MFQTLITGIFIGFILAVLTSILIKNSKLSSNSIKRLIKKGMTNYNDTIDDLAALYNNIVSNLDNEDMIKRVTCDHILMKLGKIQSNLSKTDPRITDANKKEIDCLLRKINIMIETISDTLANIREE